MWNIWKIKSWSCPNFVRLVSQCQCRRKTNHKQMGPTLVSLDGWQSIWWETDAVWFISAPHFSRQKHRKWEKIAAQSHTHTPEVSLPLKSWRMETLFLLLLLVVTEASPETTHSNTYVFPSLFLPSGQKMVTTGRLKRTVPPSLLLPSVCASVCCFTCRWQTVHKPGCLPVPPTYQDVFLIRMQILTAGEGIAGVLLLELFSFKALLWCLCLKHLTVRGWCLHEGCFDRMKLQPLMNWLLFVSSRWWESCVVF